MKMTRRIEEKLLFAVDLMPNGTISVGIFLIKLSVYGKMFLIMFETHGSRVSKLRRSGWGGGLENGAGCPSMNSNFVCLFASQYWLSILKQAN